MTGLGDVAGWWWHVVKVSAADGWRWLPGPWPVKLTLVVLLAAGQLIPGELDELIVLAVIAGVKRLAAWWRTPYAPQCLCAAVSTWVMLCLWTPHLARRTQ